MKVNLFDCEITTDENNQLQLGERPFEPDLTHYLEAVLKPGDVFVDVGAMIGYYTLLASKKVGWKGHVYAFEPHPAHFATLEKNVRSNRRTRNVTLIEAAVMDFSAEHGILYLGKENAADHRTCYNERDREIVPVEYVTLDDYFSEQVNLKVVQAGAALPPRIDVIKLDIQGSEPYALMGMVEVLDRNPKVTIVTEFWPEGIRQAGWVPQDYLAHLEATDFILHTMDGEPREPGWIMSNIPGGWTGFMNLLCVRE